MDRLRPESEIVEELIENDEYLSGILQNIIRRKVEEEKLSERYYFNGKSLRISELAGETDRIKSEIESRLGALENSLGLDTIPWGRRNMGSILQRIDALETLVGNLYKMIQNGNTRSNN